MQNLVWKPGRELSKNQSGAEESKQRKLRVWPFFVYKRAQAYLTQENILICFA